MNVEGQIEMKKVHRIAGLKISRVAPAPEELFMEEPHGRDLLPDLEPPEERLRREKTHIFLSDSISVLHGHEMDEAFEPSLRAEHRDTTARLTVYALNATVAVFALPVGLALFSLNILNGENLRATAHTLALTGMFMALGATDEGARLFSMIGV